MLGVLIAGCLLFGLVVSFTSWCVSVWLIGFGFGIACSPWWLCGFVFWCCVYYSLFGCYLDGLSVGCRNSVAY